MFQLHVIPTQSVWVPEQDILSTLRKETSHVDLRIERKEINNRHPWEESRHDNNREKWGGFPCGSRWSEWY